MVIFKREVKRNRKSTLLWTSVLLSYNVFMLLLYPSMVGSLKDSMDIMLASIPKGMISAFGLDKVSMTEILGFYNTYCYLLVTILGGIFAVIQGSSILSKEEDEKTIEFLLSKPVSRNKIITSKIFAVLTNLVILNIIISIISFVTIELVNGESYNRKVLLLLFIAPVFMQITFAAIGLLISIFIVKARINFPTGVGIVLGCYFISIIATISSKADFLKYLTPFKYVDGADIITKQTIDPIYLIIMSLITLTCGIATYIIYNKKDIIA
jgi:ABC-2 type transport system permease protein